jgi:hypothetical protein
MLKLAAFTAFAIAAAIVGNELNANQAAASPWPAAEKAPAKAPPGNYPDKPTGWKVQRNEAANPIELEWRDSTGMFAIVSREYSIPFASPFLESSAFQKLPMEIGNRLLEPALFYRAYFIKDHKYFELPTPLGYTLEGTAGYVEMWYKGDKLDMLDGIPAKGGKYHKPVDIDSSDSPILKGARPSTKTGKSKQGEQELAPSLNPRALDTGATYVVSRETPLMPFHSPADPLEAIKKMKHIPEGGSFVVVDVHYKTIDHPWYKVRAYGRAKTSLGTGWINSNALLGQHLGRSK